MKVGSVVYRYNRLPCVDRNAGTETSISRGRRVVGPLVHVAKRLANSSICHFKPFAFLHPICDGALTCSSIPSTGSNTTGIRTLDGKWQDKNGTPIRDSVVELDTSGQTVTDELCASFLAMCQAFGGTGCNVASGRRRSIRGCFRSHKQDHVQAVRSGHTSARCSSFSVSV